MVKGVCVVRGVCVVGVFVIDMLLCLCLQESQKPLCGYLMKQAKLPLKTWKPRW